MWRRSIGPSCGVTVPAAALACAGRLLRSWRRVLETLRHGTRGAGEGAELLAVAVDPAARGGGRERSWLRGSSPRSGRRGQDAAHVVVAAGNETAVALYRRTGFDVVERFELHAGTESLLMQWTSSQPMRRDDGGPARRRGRPRVTQRSPYRCASWSPAGPGIMDRPGALKTHADPRAVSGWGGRLRRRGGRRVGRSADRAGPVGRRPGGRDRRRPVRHLPRRCGSWPSWAWEPASPPPSRSTCRAGSVCHSSWPPPSSSINGFNLLDGLDMLAAGVGAGGRRRVRRRSPMVPLG